VLFVPGSTLGFALRHLGNVAGPRGDVPLQVVAVPAVWGSSVRGVGPDVVFLPLDQVGGSLRLRLAKLRSEAISYRFLPSPGR
jgi:hypothetical protein